MKRILPLALSVLLIAAPAMAGEVNVPSKTDPPQPPATTTSTTDTATTAILLWLLTLVSK